VRFKLANTINSIAINSTQGQFCDPQKETSFLLAIHISLTPAQGLTQEFICNFHNKKQGREVNLYKLLPVLCGKKKIKLKTYKE